VYNITDIVNGYLSANHCDEQSLLTQASHYFEDSKNSIPFIIKYGLVEQALDMLDLYGRNRLVVESIDWDIHYYEILTKSAFSAFINSNTEDEDLEQFLLCSGYTSYKEWLDKKYYVEGGLSLKLHSQWEFCFERIAYSKFQNLLSNKKLEFFAGFPSADDNIMPVAIKSHVIVCKLF